MSGASIRGIRAGALAAALVGLAASAPSHAAPHAPPLAEAVEAGLRAQVGAGTRFGLVVATMDGKELVAIDPDGRYVPASATKLFTAAAAFAALPGLDGPDAEGGASVRLEARAGGAPPDVVLEGHGDGRLSSAPDCRTDCLAALADAVAASTRRVGDVIGDDRWFADERWSPGMSWNNIATRSGTAVSALALDENVVTVTVAPGPAGRPVQLSSPGYFAFDNEAVTLASGSSSLGFDRLPGSRTVRLTGALVAGAAPVALRLGIDDPADYAAWRLKALLEARGVKVTGRIGVRHRPAGTSPPTPPTPAPPLARLIPPPLAQDILATEKNSDNLHAELLLRRVARRAGDGTVAAGGAAVRALLTQAGLTRGQYDFFDGSGMSSYNRLSPRGAVAFLRWASAQPWGAALRASLPVAGVDGTLASRFKGSLLEGRLSAKTGTLNAATALVGYLNAASGRPLVFAAFAGDMPEGAEATKAIDAALLAVAAAN
ncbi:MAG: D-alanyl-D-alanine carboxypeptidase/D-alanyl-D-alanine-endopeptidase [Allosphingosinicella sp.]